MSVQHVTTYGERFRFSTAEITVYAGKGSPEGVVVALPGDLYLDAEAISIGAAVWIKGAGVGPTGWSQAPAPVWSRTGTELSPATAGDRVKLTGQYYSPMKVHGAAGATETFDWADGNDHRVMLDADCVFSFEHPVDGARYVIVVVQDATGGHVVTWPASVRWPDDTEPAFDLSPNAANLVVLLYDATSGRYLAAASTSYVLS